MVLAFAAAEGTANDWLSLALIDGYDVGHWVGVLGFAVFVTAMTAGRLAGPPLLDRYGRAPVLWATSAAAAVGVAARRPRRATGRWSGSASSSGASVRPSASRSA